MSEDLTFFISALASALTSTFYALADCFSILLLARIIHDGSSRNRAVAKRDRRAEPRGREASLNRMLTD